MSKSIQRFAIALEKLERENGLEQTSQLLADCLLACGARMVGDCQYTWTVKKPFVSGEVSVITDRALLANR